MRWLFTLLCLTLSFNTLASSPVVDGQRTVD